MKQSHVKKMDQMIMKMLINSLVIQPYSNDMHDMNVVYVLSHFLRQNISFWFYTFSMQHQFLPRHFFDEKSCQIDQGLFHDSVYYCAGDFYGLYLFHSSAYYCVEDFYVQDYCVEVKWVDEELDWLFHLFVIHIHASIFK